MGIYLLSTICSVSKRGGKEYNGLLSSKHPKILKGQFRQLVFFKLKIRITRRNLNRTKKYVKFVSGL